MKKEPVLSAAPLTIRQVNRLLVIIIVVLALFAGYFHAKYSNEVTKLWRLQKKYTQLEDAYDTIVRQETTKDSTISK